MHRITLYQNGSSRDITHVCADAELNDELEALSVEFSCTVLRNDKTDKYAHWYNIRPGDKLRVSGEGGEVFAGTILSVGQDGSLLASDAGWNLQRSEVILQLDKAAAPDAVGQLCGKAGIPAGDIDLPPTKISKVFWGDTPEAILDEILTICSAETGKRYFRRVRQGKLQVRPLPESVLTLRGDAPGQGSFDPTRAKGAISGTDSAEDLINAVVLTDKDGKQRKILGDARNDKSVETFGLLQKVETLSGDETAAQARQRLKNLLALGDVVHRERTVELWGDDRAVSGALVQFVPNRYDVSGPLRILSVSHRYGVNHTMTVTVELPRERAAGSGDTVNV